jgi:hypothetical protein
MSNQTVPIECNDGSVAGGGGGGGGSGDKRIVL